VRTDPPIVPPEAYAPYVPEPMPPQLIAEGIARCDELVDRYGGGRLAGIPSSDKPTACDLATHAEVNVCGCCGQRTRRVWLYRDRLLLCRGCAEGRVRAGEVLARPPWRPGQVGDKAA
jgi:hypothetical protein